MSKEANSKKGLTAKKNTLLIILIVIFYTFYEMASIHYVYGKYNKIIDNGLVAIAAFGELKINTNDIENAVSKVATLSEMSTVSTNMPVPDFSSIQGSTVNGDSTASDGTAPVAGTIPTIPANTDATGFPPISGVMNTADISTYCETIEKELSDCAASIEKYEALGINSESYSEFQEKYDDYKKILSKFTAFATAEPFSGSKIVEIYNDEFIAASSDLKYEIEKLLGESIETQQTDVKKLQTHKTSNDISMYIIAVVIIVVLLGVDSRRAKMTQDLIDSQEKVEKQKGKISSAVFKDVLTQTNNRTSFISRFSKDNEKLEAGSAYYFVMFNVDDFSSVNSTHGVQSGDMILSSTAEKLRTIFEAENIYRTGSDEFVAVVRTSANPDGFSRVSGMVDKARLSLGSAQKIRNGSLIVSYSVSVVKKQGPGAVDASEIFAPLKESMKQGRMTQPGVVMFTEI